MNDTLNVLIIGAGMYVCGRGTDGYGTIFPALAQKQKEGLSINLYLAATSRKSVDIALEKLQGLNKKLGSSLEVKETFPAEGKDKKSYKEAIRQIPKPASGIVVVPDYLHAEVTKELFINDMHALVVKPLTPTAEEAHELIELKNKHNVYGMVEFHKRWDESNLKVKSNILDKKIGDVLYINVEYSQRKIIPEEIFSGWAATTNIFQYLGVHYVDMIYFLTRAFPKRVMALGQKNWLVKKGVDTYDSIQGIIDWEMEDGKRFTSTLLMNWIDPNCTSAMSDQLIKVFGTNGRIECDQKHRGVYKVSDEGGIEDINPYFSDYYLDVQGEDYNFAGYGAKSIFQFLEDIGNIQKGKSKPEELGGLRPTFEESLVSTSVSQAVKKSLEKKSEWVYIGEDFRLR